MVRISRLTAVFVLATLAPAQDKDDSPDRLLAAAEQARADGKPEAACTDLRQALRELEESPDPQPRLRRKIGKLLATLDPELKARKKGYACAARKLIALSNTYKRLKWYRLSLNLLWEAESLDPKLTARPLTSLKKVAPEIFGDLTEARNASLGKKQERAAGPHEFVPMAPEHVESMGWKVEKKLITSAELTDAKTVVVLLEKPVCEDCIVSIEFLRPKERGQAALVFGAKGYSDYFLFEAEYHERNTVHLCAYYWNGTRVTMLGNKTINLAAEVRANWLRYAARVQGKKATFMLGDKELLTVDCVREPYGMAGVHISSSTRCKKPIRCRKLVVRNLPKPKLNAAEVLSTNIAAAEKNLEEGKKEQAVVKLVAARRRIGDITTEAERTTMRERIDELLRTATVKYAALEKARRGAAAELSKIADAYRAAKWETTAQRVARDAAALW